MNVLDDLEMICVFEDNGEGFSHEGVVVHQADTKWRTVGLEEVF
jgi:hypothetical protein